jgi:hypothetical protein
MNKKDPLNFNSIPIHACHMNGEFSGISHFFLTLLTVRIEWSQESYEEGMGSRRGLGQI